MNGTANQPLAKKYRFAALELRLVLAPRSGGFLASAPISRAIHGMVPTAWIYGSASTARLISSGVL